jgi:hypothetical protein
MHPVIDYAMFLAKRRLLFVAFRDANKNSDTQVLAKLFDDNLTPSYISIPSCNAAVR